MTTALAVSTSTGTVLDALVDAIRAAATYNKQDQTPPASVLWPDKERQFEPLVPALREHVPLYVLGAYAPDEQTGPAYWLRCITERTLTDVAPPTGDVPVIYLPGISRQDIRAVDTCPRQLQPIAELQYRGVIWTQKNGRDWTLAAFLQSTEGGLSLSVASDISTRDALRNVLLKLVDEPVERLRREGQLRAPFLNSLLHPDDVKNVLRWLNDPPGFRAQCDAANWGSFRSLAKNKYSVDPELDGPAPAARRLAQREGNWDVVWRRFAEAPRAYPAIPDLLRQARPKKISPLFEAGTYPQDNEVAESELRQALLSLAGVHFTEAAQRVLDLDNANALRRDWVWAALGQAPLVLALSWLAQVARRAATGRGSKGSSARDIIQGYVGDGWQVDAAVLRSLAAVETQADQAAVHAAVRALYTDWLEHCAVLMQTTLRTAHPPEFEPAPAPTVSAGTCLLFSDGLRYDLAQALAERLRQRSLGADVSWQMTSLPSITATAKPGVSPAANLLSSGASLEPTYGGTKVTVSVLRKALTDGGHQVLLADDLGDPSGTAWTELGDIDAYGHEHGWKIARQVDGELRSLTERIEALLEAGWQRVVVVTDHGWLLLPGGLPKVNFPEHLTEVRKGRCARLKPTSTTTELTVPWRWDPNVLFAFATGSACFEAGKEYEHGGISPQECITPVVTVTRADAAATVTIASVAWRGLRCAVSVDGLIPGVHVDLRTKAADPSSSLAIGGAKPVGTDGSVSLPVDDEHEGTAAVVVVIAPTGAVLTYTSTAVGG